MSDFATSDAALGLGLTGGEGREVVVEEELHVALVEDIVHHLLVEFGAESGGGEALCLTACEDGRTVRHGQGADFAPDGADVGGVASVEAYSLVKDAAAHGILLDVVVVTVDERILLFQFLGCEFGVAGGVLLLEVFADGLESVEACVLFQTLASDVVGRLVAGFANGGAELLVVHLVAVFALHVGAEFLCEFNLEAAHGLDGLVGSLEGFEECAFGHFLHFAFHHHDVVFGGSDHEVHISLLELCEGGVDDVFAVDACYAYFRDGSFEGNVGACEGSRCGKTCKGIGHVHTVGTEEDDVDINLGVIIAGEEGAEGAVNESGGKDFVVTGATFALGETSGEASGGRVLLFVVALKGHEVGAGGSVFGTADGGKQHRVVHAEHHRSVGLLCQFSSLNADGTPIRQRDSLCDNVHRKNIIYKSVFVGRKGILPG